MFFWRRGHTVSERDLSAYIDGELTIAATGRIAQHIDECSACRATLEELRSLRSALGELPVVAAPRSFVLREADVRTQAGSPAYGTPGGRAPVLVGGLASVALVAFLSLVSIDVLGDPSIGGSLSDRSSLTEDAGDAGFDGFGAEFGQSYGPPEVTANGIDELDTDDDTFLESTAQGTPPLSIFNDGSQRDEDTGDGVLPDADGALGGAAAGGAEPDGDDSSLPLRAAEATAAAIALVAGGWLLVFWRRRRATS